MQVNEDLARFNLITAYNLARFYQNKCGWPQLDGNSRVLVETLALHYIEAGGTRYRLDYDDNRDPVLVLNEEK